MSRQGFAENRSTRFDRVPASQRALGLQQLRQVGSLNPEARGLPVEDGESDAAPLRRMRRFFGTRSPCTTVSGSVSQKAVNSPQRDSSSVELRQEISQDASACPRLLLAGAGAARSLLARSTGGPGSAAVPGPAGRTCARTPRHGAESWRANARPDGGAPPARGAIPLDAGVLHEEPAMLPVLVQHTFRSNGGWAWAGAEAVPRRRRSRPPRSCACRSLRSRVTRPGRLPRAGIRHACGTAWTSGPSTCARLRAAQRQPCA